VWEGVTHDPQYCGMCWLRDMVQKLTPSLLHHVKAVGTSSVATVSCGSGLREDGSCRVRGRGGVAEYRKAEGLNGKCEC
jgi:hypothetical protein